MIKTLTIDDLKTYEPLAEVWKGVDNSKWIMATTKAKAGEFWRENKGRYGLPKVDHPKESFDELKAEQSSLTREKIEEAIVMPKQLIYITGGIKADRTALSFMLSHSYMSNFYKGERQLTIDQINLSSLLSRHKKRNDIVRRVKSGENYGYYWRGNTTVKELEKLYVKDILIIRNVFTKRDSNGDPDKEHIQFLQDFIAWRARYGLVTIVETSLEWQDDIDWSDIHQPGFNIYHPKGADIFYDLAEKVALIDLT